MRLETPEDVEQARRSVVMLSPGAPALNREQALEVFARLQRAMGEQRSDGGPCATKRPWR